MNQGVDMLREQLVVWDTNRKTNAFYSILYEYDYKGEGVDKHPSPTKRLIQQKNVYTAHKRRFSGAVDRKDYSLMYNTGLTTSYIIEPKLGEANYQLAEEDPLDFYEELFVQPVVEHKVKKDMAVQKRIDEENKVRVEKGLPKSTEVAPLIIKTEVTIRPFQKAMEKLRRKIAERLMKSVDFSTLDKLMDLLKIPAVEDEIKELVITDKLQIVDQNDNVLYDKELKEGLGLKKEQSLSDSFFAKTSSPLK